MRWLLCLLMGAAVAAGAQQGSTGNSGSAPQSDSSHNGANSSSAPAAPAPGKTASGSKSSDTSQGSAPGLASHPPLDSLSTDTTFPGDRPTADRPGKAAGTKPAAPNVRDLTPPRSDRVRADELGSDAGQSSSKDTEVDLSAPADDAKAHPKSNEAVATAESASGVGEFHLWDPHKAAKSVEVGDYYFKRKNYRAAEDRYREALTYKDNDAIATIRLAECMEKLGNAEDARAEYESYLKILPHGPDAEKAQKAIERLNTASVQSK